MLRKAFYSTLLTILVGIAVVVTLVSHQLFSSRPQRAGEVRVVGLNSPVAVRFDPFGVPDILAGSRLDALFALGYVTAGDRLFQMDLIRRKSSGKLAEIFGQAALKFDTRQRHLNFERAAQRIVDGLPTEQRRALEAYARGVNAYLEQVTGLPPEFALLQYEPARWTANDSVLVVLSMFQLLSWTEPEERLLTIMNECLPETVRSFLTPDTDRYTSVLTGGPESARPIRSIPATELAVILEQNRASHGQVQVEATSEPAGSNNWAVNYRKTADGSAIIANDMHLPIAVPNIWYRATLRYPGHVVSGLNLPGLPTIVAGSNGRVAWGFTNFMADVMDLVKLEIDPRNPERYMTPQGWRKLKSISHRIEVKDGTPVNLNVRMSIWGPVWQDSLLGQPMAIHWTATDPEAVDLGLMDMDGTKSVKEAVAVVSRAGGPPQNVLLADDQGNIAWTLMGRFPRRVDGFDGSVSSRWDNQSGGWDGYLNPDQLPRVINPSSGFLATANSRNVGRDYPFVLGHNFAHSYRTFRIGERLKAMRVISEEDLFQLQLDTKTDFYEFYRALASSLLTRRTTTKTPLLTEIRGEIDAWDGFARVDSRGLPIIVAFRNLLAERVFGPFLKSCATRDKAFKYSWFEMETPLRQLLDGKVPETLPDNRFKSWDNFLIATLEESARELKKRHSLATLERFTWGQFRQIRITHPLSRGLPWLAGLLDMPVQQYGGCNFCVRVISTGLSASERFVISPGRPERGILHMPGGQSGHFLSAHYADQQPYWAKGLALSYRSDRVNTVLRLVP